MTSAFVLDASVALSWCFEDEARPESDALLHRLADGGAIVPVIWEYEVANVLAVAERRGRLSEAEVARRSTLLRSLPIHVVRDLDPTSLLQTARQHVLSAYDAAYLIVAEREGLPLATRDAALASAAAAAGVATLPA
ncbi:twitching motility protein PilT [Agromyces luteolus]|uniref:Ribonuclease VapC n=1 Tax=Agromyces luteolus TaxID=88373 RepID=A0A7C9HHM0_9MICO|nr:type II toxin-antitoxin system VapC family toxin [Agromyces luteolus]MUN07083.1 PIN domain-containing protein [Agromyces luteolus]GLK27334.1 twitching motility protein PilT [Agromyces luteolus]